jgi:enoyl-CoA hydratase/carnithine racemase
MTNPADASSSLKQHRDAATLWLTLNRPDKRNAMDDAMLHSLGQALKQAFADQDVRSIVITGAGNCLSAGRDFKNLGARGAQPVRLDNGTLEDTVDLFTDVLNLLLEAPKPVIAAVRGFAVGGGQALTLACDFVVAESDAQFGNVEIAYGFPAALNAVLLGRHLGRRLALEIALTGTLRTPGQYQALGLVNRVCEPGALEQTTRAFCELLNQRAPWAVRRTKSLMRMAEDAPLSNAMHLGGQLNQLLRMDASVTSAYEQGSATRAQLRSSVAP